MTEVRIAAADEDKKMWQTFPYILCMNLGAISLHRDGNLSDSPIGIGDICDLGRAHADHTILICKESAQIPRRPLAENNSTIAVVDADGGAKILERMSCAALPAITCGMSAKDTLTLSSYGTDNAVITVQRTLTAFNGSVVEPQEIPVSLSGSIDSFTIMAAAAVFLLTGNEKRLQKAVFSQDRTNNSQ